MIVSSQDELESVPAGPTPPPVTTPPPTTDFPFEPKEDENEEEDKEEEKKGGAIKNKNEDGEDGEGAGSYYFWVVIAVLVGQSLLVLAFVLVRRVVASCRRCQILSQQFNTLANDQPSCQFYGDLLAQERRQEAEAERAAAAALSAAATNAAANEEEGGSGAGVAESDGGAAGSGAGAGAGAMADPPTSGVKSGSGSGGVLTPPHSDPIASTSSSVQVGVDYEEENDTEIVEPLLPSAEEEERGERNKRSSFLVNDTFTHQDLYAVDFEDAANMTEMPNLSLLRDSQREAGDNRQGMKIVKVDKKKKKVWFAKDI